MDPIETSIGENSDQDEEIPQEGLPILIQIEKYEGGPVFGTFFTKGNREIINGCVQNTL